MFTSIGNWIRYRDLISKPCYMRLHFDESYNKKTVIGGLLSVIIELYVLRIALVKGYSVVLNYMEP